MKIIVSSSKFNYNARSKTFVSEISEARENFGDGFYIRSEKTGDKKLFLYDKMDRTHDGEDVAGWWYFSPGEGYKALIIND
jgi:hypothetical protein